MDFNYLLLIIFFTVLGGILLANFQTWQLAWAKKLFLSKQDTALLRPAWATSLIVAGSNFLVITFLLSFVLPSGVYTNFYIFGIHIPVYLWLLIGSLIVLIMGFFSYYIFSSKSFSVHKMWDKKAWQYHEIEFVSIIFSKKNKPHFELEISFPDQEDLCIDFLGTDIQDFALVVDMFEQNAIKLQITTLPTPEDYQKLSPEEKEILLPYLPEVFPK